MKQLSAAISILAASVGLAAGQVQDTYVNNGIAGASPGGPPTVDAINFVNNGQFYATNVFLTDVYHTYDTLTFSNRNLMVSTIGFEFDFSPSGNAPVTRAASFNNANLVNVTNSSIYGGSLLKISATNVVNRGLLGVGYGGDIQLSGDNVDLSRGTIRVDGFINNTNLALQASLGVFSYGWGLDTNVDIQLIRSVVGNQGVYFGVQTFTDVTNLFNGSYVRSNLDLSVLNQTAGTNFLVPVCFINSNATAIYHSLVFLQNVNPAVGTDIRFKGGSTFVHPIIQWSNVVAAPDGTSVVTNYLYLEDDFAGTDTLDLFRDANGGSLNNTTPFRPRNYTVGRTLSGAVFPSLPGPSGPGLNFTNLFINQTQPGVSASYDAVILPTTYNPPQQGFEFNVTNQPGRIDIVADKVLTLNQTRIDGLNYMSVRATNHFAGSTNAYITVPVCDINLASTNGILLVTNLLSSYSPRLVGELQMCSSRWTNTDDNGIIHYWSILMVNSALNPYAPTEINNLGLRSANLQISDILNVRSNLSINAQNITITTNSSAFTRGELNVQSTLIPFDESISGLLNFTNYGLASSINTLYFGTLQPLQTFVNQGLMDAFGNEINAGVFQNGGTIVSESTHFQLQSTTAVMTNSVILATNDDISLQATDLMISNSVLIAGRTLSLSVNGSLSDGGGTNIWTCNDGFNLFTAPTSGDLHYTTVTNLAVAHAQTYNTWGARDLGATPAGFSNNAALGHLVLDGGLGSQFVFTGTTGSNALYIDYLELKDDTTNFRTAFSIDPNITLYVGSSSPVAPDKLQNFYSSRIVWVSNYAGIYSTTNVALRSGTNTTANISLVNSTTIDSDGDGVPNGLDPYPFDGLNFSFSASGPANSKVITISWYADSASWPYYIQSSTDLKTWTTVATLTSGLVAGQQMTQTYSVASGAPTFYRVQTASH